MKRVIRRQQTIDAAARLERGIADWVRDWRAEDGNEALGRTERHHTHLNAIEAVLGGAATALLLEARAVSAADAEGLVYRQCREVDETLSWLYRLWDFYRQRLDQRRDPALRDTVIAADEIVWSTFSQVMTAPAVRRSKVPHGPAPLPYIHDDYSPAAIDQRRVPPELRMPLEFPSWDSALSAIIEQLAVPLLELPRWCVGSPWWLVFIAHEVGHHLTARLEVREDLEAALHAAVAPLAGEPAARSWVAWTEEVLADAWSIALVGRSAAEALAEIELSAPDDMRRQTTREYPPAALRLALMGRLAVALGMGAPTLPEVTAQAALLADPGLAPQAAALDAIRDVLTGELSHGLGSLLQLCDLPGPRLVAGVDAWSARLRSDDEVAATMLSSARLMSAGCFVAWQRLRTAALAGPLQNADAALKTFTDATQTLAESATGRLARSGPPGTRAAVQATKTDPASAAALAQRLLALARHGAGVHSAASDDATSIANAPSGTGA